MMEVLNKRTSCIMYVESVVNDSKYVYYNNIKSATKLLAHAHIYVVVKPFVVYAIIEVICTY